ncbi:hypothetical protein PRIPAC_72606 [Pristionchus pacificus]|uniref:glucuronosyltransferase n=1 Tax=Pristionchus pacificus TaxID=54126 RepID=A0A2A6CF37_PRIPA|nr:hypothetical protein PRIPAC_72606 [Pristionchus pacificus]|eukprot:PDM76673.1 glucuronosyltransferase [Pristionchus pacificus]
MNLLNLLLLSPIVATLSNESYSIQLCPGCCTNSTSLPSIIHRLPVIDNVIIDEDKLSPIHRPSILFHGMHSSDSHIGSMLPTMKSMVAGLDVEVHLLETHFRPNRYNLPSEIDHTFISIDDIKYFDEEVFAPMWTASKGADYFAFAWVPGERALRQLATDYSDQFRSILKKRWDLMVIDDLFTVTGYSIAMRNHNKHDRPYILMSTTLPTIHWQSMMSLGNNGLYRGSLYAPWDFTVSRFSHRLEAIYQALLNGLGMKMINEWLLTTGPSLLGITDYSISRLVSDATYYYLDDVNYFSYPSPIGHDVVHVGLSCPPQGDRLPNEYEQFVASNHSKGVIYIAFGSNVPWKFAPAHHMRVFVQGLNHFRDHRVIFSFNGRPEQLEGLGDHVMVTKWAPQKEILSDQRTKLYITHGGLKRCA